MSSVAHPRSIRSYVIRDGRMTTAQAAALEQLLPVYGALPQQLADAPQLFQRRAPLHLEIGIGNGDNLIEMARAAPCSNFLGCEVHRPGLGHALHRAHDYGLDNVRFLHADVNDVLLNLADAALDSVYMFFPDPWPKRRHHKRRLLNAATLDRIADKLRSSGCFFFATDHRDYGRAALRILEASPRWLNLAGRQCFAPRLKRRILTRFEQRAVEAGRSVYELAAIPLSGRDSERRV